MIYFEVPGRPRQYQEWKHNLSSNELYYLEHYAIFKQSIQHYARSAMKEVPTEKVSIEVRFYINGVSAGTPKLTMAVVDSISEIIPMGQIAKLHAEIISCRREKQRTEVTIYQHSGGISNAI